MEVYSHLERSIFDNLGSLFLQLTTYSHSIFHDGILSKKTSIRFGSIRTPEWPMAHKILPQFASIPKKAVFTNGEWAMA